MKLIWKEVEVRSLNHGGLRKAHARTENSAESFSNVADFLGKSISDIDYIHLEEITKE